MAIPKAPTAAEPDPGGATTSPRDHDAATWKTAFDGIPAPRAAVAAQPHAPSDIGCGHPRFVAGRPRDDGMAGCLDPRVITVPLGRPDDHRGMPNMRMPGRPKDRYFPAPLEQHDASSGEAAISLGRTLRTQGIKTAVVSSSSNCAAVREAAGDPHYGRSSP